MSMNEEDFFLPRREGNKLFWAMIIGSSILIAWILIVAQVAPKSQKSQSQITSYTCPMCNGTGHVE